MNEDGYKKSAVASLVCGCIVYAISIYASAMMISHMFNSFDFENPQNMEEDMLGVWISYFDTLNAVKIPVLVFSVAGILLGLPGLRAPKKQKGMAIAGLVLGSLYLVVHLFMIGIYQELLQNFIS